jgi:hypothetical protein
MKQLLQQALALVQEAYDCAENLDPPWHDQAELFLGVAGAAVRGEKEPEEELAQDEPVPADQLPVLAEAPEGAGPLTPIIPGADHTSAAGMTVAAATAEEQMGALEVVQRTPADAEGNPGFEFNRPVSGNVEVHYGPDGQPTLIHKPDRWPPDGRTERF